MDPLTEQLAALVRLLPRIAEEGGDRESVGEAELVQGLSNMCAVSTEASRTVLAVVRRLLQSMSVLDERILSTGEWAFVSFPASLLARSLISGLASPEFRLLEGGFWDPSDYRVDRQRALIKQLEELRASPLDGVAPIRRVWVSCALVALEGRFLLVRREDTSEHREGSRGQFVLPGGRVSPHDLPGLSLAARLDFFDPGCKVEPDLAGPAFDAALRRELNEELDLTEGQLEKIEPVGAVLVHNALEGAKSAFSATEYRIQPFRIELTSSGKITLLKCLAKHPRRFDWFTGTELAAGVNSTGAKAFVDAISGGALDLHPEAYEIPLSSARRMPEFVDVPAAPGEPFLVGITGREKQAHVDLSADDLSALSWFVAVTRNEEVGEFAPNVSVAKGTGWVIVEDERCLARLNELATKLDRSNLPLLEFHGRAVRLKVATPYYSPSRLSLEIQDERRGTAYRVKVSRSLLDSYLGVAPARSVTFTLPDTLGNAIYALAQGDPGPALDNLETVKRMQRDIRAHLDTIGARLLVRQVDGVPELAVGR